MRAQDADSKYWGADDRLQYGESSDGQAQRPGVKIFIFCIVGIPLILGTIVIGARLLS